MSANSLQALPRITYSDADQPMLKRAGIRLVERLSGRPAVERIYRQVKATETSPQKFFGACLRQADIQVDWCGAALNPEALQGPLVIIANHPFGVVDGLAICDLATRIRGEFRILINHRLCRDPALNPFFLPISFENERDARVANVEARRNAIESVSSGLPLVVFPGGGIATSPDRFGRQPAQELPWTPFLASILKKTRATVLPVAFLGENSRAFQMASHVSQSLRLALIPNETRRFFGHRLTASIGRPIPPAEYAQFTSRRSIVEYLQNRIENLLSESTRDRLIA